MADPDLTEHFVAEFQKLQAALRQLQEEAGSAPPPVMEPPPGPDQRDVQLAELARQLAEAQSQNAQLQELADEARRRQVAAVDEGADLRDKCRRLESTCQDLARKLGEAQTELEGLRKKGIGAGDGPSTTVGAAGRASEPDLIVALRLQLEQLRQENRKLVKTNLKLEQHNRELEEKLLHNEAPIRRLKGGL